MGFLICETYVEASYFALRNSNDHSHRVCISDALRGAAVAGRRDLDIITMPLAAAAISHYGTDFSLPRSQGVVRG
jgi:hypothetical protein